MAACRQLCCDGVFLFLFTFCTQLQFYRSPSCQRDCPHLLVRMKRRVGVKSASRQTESEAEAPGVPPAAPRASPRPEGVPSSAGDQREPVSSRQRGGPTAGGRSQSAPPATLGAAARPTLTEPPAAVGRPQGAQSPITLAANGAEAAAFPWVCLPLPSGQVHPCGPLLGLAAGPPVLLPVPTTQPPGAGLLPVCHPRAPGGAAAPAAAGTVIPHPRNPFHCCPDGRCSPKHLPPTDGPPEYPHCTHYSS